MAFDTRTFEIGKNRIEALSDGIFAIVMTLLILEFHVPNLPLSAPNVEVAPALLALWPKFVSYTVTFVSLGFFWVGHHVMYHAIRRADRTLLWLNIFFFMFVSLLPFSTSVLNAFSEAFIAPLFFGANLAIIGWLLFFQWSYANSQPDMLADLEAQPLILRRSRFFRLKTFALSNHENSKHCIFCGKPRTTDSHP
jgi:uncharacterized membrane protein